LTYASKFRSAPASPIGSSLTKRCSPAW